MTLVFEQTVHSGAHGHFFLIESMVNPTIQVSHSMAVSWHVSHGFLHVAAVSQLVPVRTFPVLQEEQIVGPSSQVAQKPTGMHRHLLSTSLKPATHESHLKLVSWQVIQGEVQFANYSQFVSLSTCPTTQEVQKLG